MKINTRKIPLDRLSVDCKDRRISVLTNGRSIITVQTMRGNEVITCQHFTFDQFFLLWESLSNDE